MEFDRATGGAVDRRLTALIGAAGAVGVTEPVTMEVLAGARTDERELDLRRLMQRFSRHQAATGCRSRVSARPSHPQTTANRIGSRKTAG